MKEPANGYRKIRPTEHDRAAAGFRTIAGILLTSSARVARSGLGISWHAVGSLDGGPGAAIRAGSASGDRRVITERIRGAGCRLDLRPGLCGRRIIRTAAWRGYNATRMSVVPH